MDFIELKSLLKNPDNYWAHTKEDEEGNIIGFETLKEHTNLCCKNFKRLFEEMKLTEIIERFIGGNCPELKEDGRKLFWNMLVNIIIFHDLGKMNPNFQRVKMKREDIPRQQDYNVAGSRHSCISAVLYIDYFSRLTDGLEDRKESKLLECFLLYNSYLIDRHHSGLISFSDYLKSLKSGRENDIIEKFEGNQDAYLPKFHLDGKKIDNICKSVLQRRDRQSRRECIWLYTYEKLLYSLLVASDFYAASEFESGLKIEQGGNIEDIDNFMNIYNKTKISQAIRTYEKMSYPGRCENIEGTTEINILRTELFLDAERALQDNLDKNIFYLEAPTGGGKSNISMNLSFQLMRYNNFLRKIFYVYPFNTLVEQNRVSLEKVFENSKDITRQIAVVNSITPIKRIIDSRLKESEDEGIKYYQRALLDRQFLNYPIVLTTHVSLFDIMFGDTKESAFAFHQLAGSVIVLDEIQSYKNKIWGEMISFLKEMADILSIKIIIMSATLPNLHMLADNAEGTVELIKNREKYFLHPCFRDRVDADYTLLKQEYNEERLLEHMTNNMKPSKKVLVEFIKKETASSFYQKAVSELGKQTLVLYMSGDDSLLERKKIISSLKNDEERPILLVATQVIEAGVDIDMDIGYKSISMFDSEEQFAGRINRSFLRNGKIYFFKADEPKNIYREEIRLNPELMITNPVMQEIFINKDFPEYYRRVLQVIKANFNEAGSERGLESFLQDCTGHLGFPEVKVRMRLIEDDQWNMSVYLARVLETEDGEEIDGKSLWRQYRELLENSEIEYAEKRVKLSDITSSMSGFIYQVKKNADFVYDDIIGDIFYIENGEKYFDNGKLNRKKIQGEIGDFVDFI